MSFFSRKSFTRYSLRTLLIVCALVALEIKFGFIPEAIRRYTISRVHAAGGRVHYDETIQSIWKSQKIVLIDQTPLPASIEKYQLDAFPNLIEMRIGPLATDPNVAGGAVVDVEHQGGLPSKSDSQKSYYLTK